MMTINDQKLKMKSYNIISIEKQLKYLLYHDNKITIKKYTYDFNDTPFISKQKEIFNKLVDEKLEKITAKQLSGFNPLSLSNNKNRRLEKEVFFLCTLVAKQLSNRQYTKIWLSQKYHWEIFKITNQKYGF